MPEFDAPFDPKRNRIDITAVAIPDLVAWIGDKRPLAIGEWNEIGEEEYARSFTTAKSAGYDIVSDLYREFQRNLDEQLTEVDYAKRVIPILKAKGWLSDQPDSVLADRVDLIYNTNLRIARAVGKWQNYQQQKQGLPYLIFRAVGDYRTRKGHLALNNLILPVDHPIWRRAFAPLYFRCRCAVDQLSRSQALRKGGVTPDEQAYAMLAEALSYGPIWQNPALAHLAALDRVAESANENAIPGAPPIYADQTAAQGRAAWAQIFGDGVKALVDRLFSEAE